MFSVLRNNNSHECIFTEIRTDMQRLFMGE